MATIFQSAAGRVVKLTDEAAACRMQLVGAIAPASAALSFENQAAILTRIALAQQVNQQFLHTLGNQVYIYCFGDRIGQMTLSGLAFTCACGATSPGAELMYGWYRANRSSNLQGPLRVTVGRTVIEGFLSNFTLDVVDPATALAQWNASLSVLPEDY